MPSELRTCVRAIFAAGAIALLAAGCKDVVSPSHSAAISVTVKLAGVYPFDGFAIRVDDRPITIQKSEPSLVVSGISPGTHTVSLVGLPATCATAGPNPITVETSSADVLNVEFEVNCLTTSGAIAVSVSVTGYSRPLWFATQVDSASVSGIARGNATTVLFGPFPGGPHVIRLYDIPTFCESAGELSTSVNVRTGVTTVDTAVARFSIQCSPPDLGVDTAASIVFERDGFVTVMKESGGTPVALTVGENPAWSPDGKLIAFQRMNCRTVSAGGSGGTVVTSTYCEHDLWHTTAAGDESAVSYIDWLDDYDASFSPTSDRIAFIRNTTDETYLTVSDLNGGSEGYLAVNSPVDGTSWSPDGTRVAYGCQVGSGHRDLCLADPAWPCSTFNCKLPVTRLTDGSEDAGSPEWSPDGERIAFTVGCTLFCTAEAARADHYIAIIDVATHAVTTLVLGRDPAWSGDGSQLVFVGERGSPGLRIYRFADASVRQLTNNAADKSPSWRHQIR
jgi:hypothetical protein